MISSCPAGHGDIPLPRVKMAAVFTANDPHTMNLAKQFKLIHEQLSLYQKSPTGMQFKLERMASKKS